jgi:tRNA-(ms[2]io[6]A)-hydroxylase
MDLPLRAASPVQWANHIVANFDAFLCDHASCERKAAALAMSLVAKYPDRAGLVEPMVSLAREELEHFQEVFRLICRRGGLLSPSDERDPYVNGILAELRHGREERMLDRLVMSGLVEARGYERFLLLADQLTDPELVSFYDRLAQREKGHYMVFLRVARLYFSEAEIAEAINRIADIEARVMLACPIRCTLH